MLTKQHVFLLSPKLNARCSSHCITPQRQRVIHTFLSPRFFDGLSQALLCPTPGFLRRQTEGDAPQLVLKSMCVLSHVQLFTVPWTVARQAILSMGFPRQDYWSGLPLPIPGDPPDPGTEPASSVAPALAGGFFTPSAIWQAP